jgi:hypothetical protein
MGRGHCGEAGALTRKADSTLPGRLYSTLRPVSTISRRACITGLGMLHILFLGWRGGVIDQNLPLFGKASKAHQSLLSIVPIFGRILLYDHTFSEARNVPNCSTTYIRSNLDRCRRGALCHNSLNGRNYFATRKPS